MSETEWASTEQIKKRYAIFEWLHLALKPGEAVDISTITSTPQGKEYFIEQTKVFIQADLGRFYGFYIEFSSDYASVVKRELM